MADEGMEDIFERSEQHDIFRLPETAEEYRPGDFGLPSAPNPQFALPETAEEYGAQNHVPRSERAAALFRQWSDEAGKRREFAGQLSGVPGGTGLNAREAGMLYDMRERGIVDDDDIYKISSSRILGEYLGVDPGFVFSFYDDFWKKLSNDLSEKFVSHKTRWELIKDSVEIAKISSPMAGMGNELSELHARISRASNEESQVLQRRADESRAEELWKEIEARRAQIEELGKRMPKDALSFVLSSTIQSAPLTLKTMGAGLAGSVAGGAAGFFLGGVPGIAGGAILGYKLASAAMSSRELAGLMYIDLLAAGVRKNNARTLSFIGGTVNGIIESALGTVAGAGGALAKTLGGKALSEGAKQTIAEAASKRFITNITRNIAARTAVDMAKDIAGEGLEEGLQFFVEQGMLAIADAMQDSPVGRDLIGSREFWNGMRESLLGGMAGGLGFGIAGLPFTVGGNISQTARQTRALKDISLAAGSEEEFLAEARENPLTKNLSDSELGRIWRAGQRQRAEEEARRAEELRQRRLYGSTDNSGEVYRDGDGSLEGEITRHVESGGIETLEYVVGNPKKGGENAYAVLRGETRGGKTEITSFTVGEKYEGLREEILQNFANETGREIKYGEAAYRPKGAARARRFGFDTGRTEGRAAASAFSFNRPRYTAADTRADIRAKENFSRQILEAGTEVKTSAQADAIVGLYDQVGRKWFNMGFDRFMSRIAENPDSFITSRDMDDKQVAGWYQTKYSAEELAARDIDFENLTDEQRRIANESVKGFTVPGLDGVTKSINAAKNADISTFIHEGIHAFTNLARAADPELYNEMMRAAGLDANALAAADKTRHDSMLRDAWEKLAHQAERYFRDGAAPNGTLKNLFDKLKEFLRDIINLLDTRKELSPEIKALYDELFKDADASRETEAGGKNAGAVTDGVDFDIYSDELNEIIRDESRPVEERSEAVVRKARLDYTDALLDPRDRKHRPTAELIKRAMKIYDVAERAKAIEDIRRLRDMYAGTAQEFKAPNGKESLLLSSLGEKHGREAWYAVRTGNFKEYFGNWERAARIAEIENIQAKSYTPKETTKREAKTIFQNFEPVNKTFVTDFFESADVRKKPRNVSKEASSVRKLDLSVGFPGETVGKLRGFLNNKTANILSDVREIFENSKYAYSSNYTIGEARADGSTHKDHPHIAAYHHFVNKVEFEGTAYYIRFTAEELKTKGQLHAAHITEVEIINEISRDSGRSLPGKHRGGTAQPAYDLNLAEFLNSVKGNVSKVVDENGEPKVVYHGTNAEFTEFKKEFQSENVQYTEGFFFAETEEQGRLYGDKVMPVFLNAKIGREEKRKARGETGETVKTDHIHDKDRGIWIVFEPTQIKSATDNAGTYALDNPSILFQTAFMASEYIYDNAYQSGSEGKVRKHGWGTHFYSQKEAAEWVKEAKTKRGDGYEILANLYTAAIPEDAELLSWEKPLAEQPETVRKAADRIIAWDEEGKSSIATAYNIKKFNDGSYGFIRAVGGKAKWGTLKEAQKAAKADILNKYTGKDLYNSISSKIGARETSKLLDGLGVRGTKYFDKSTEKIGLPKAYNYVLFGDKDVSLSIQNDALLLTDQTAIDTYSPPVLFQLTEAEEKKYKSDIQTYKDGTINPGRLIYAGSAPDVYAKKGLPDYNITLPVSVIKKATVDKHKVEMSVIEKLPELMDSPVMILKAHSDPKAFITVLDAKDKDGKPIIVIQKPTSKKITNIQSIYGRSNFDGFIRDCIEHDMVIAADKNKVTKYVRPQERQLLKGTLLDDLSSTVSRVSENLSSPNNKNFFQDDDDFIDFVNDYPGVVKQAAEFESAEDLAGYYSVFGEMPDAVLQKALDAGYFDRVWAEAKEGKTAPAEGGADAAGAVPGYDFYKNISAKRIVTALRAYGVSMKAAFEAAKHARQENGEAVPYLEGLGVPRIDAEAYAEHARVFGHSEYLWLEKEAKNEADETAAREKRGSDSGAEGKFYSSLHENSKEVYPDHDLWENMEAELAAEGRTAKDFTAWVNTEKGFNDLVLLAARTQADGDIRGETEAETRRNEAAARAARTTFNYDNPNWKAAFDSVRAGKPVPESTKKTLRGMMRNRPLQYMEAWAVMSGDDTWLPGENDIQRIKRLDTSGLADEEYLQRQSPEELQRIGERLGSERIREKIRDGSYRWNDPDTESYEKQLKQDQAETRKKIERKKEELSDYEIWLKRAEENERRHQMIARQKGLDRTEAGIAEAKKERKKLQEAQADYRRVILDMEQFAKKLGLAQRNNYQEFRRLLREQTEQQEQLRALAELREIKKRDMRMVLRRVDLKTVHVTQAARIKWVQSHFDSYMLAAKWVGPGAKSLQQLYNQFVTDDEYREKLKKRIGEANYGAIERVIYKDVKTQDARAYSDLSVEQRRRLKRFLLDYRGIFEELGIDVEEEPKRYSPAEYAEFEAHMRDFIPADLLSKMQGKVEDEYGNFHMDMEAWTVDDMQRLAGVVSGLRREGREAEQARKDARRELLEERMARTLDALRKHLPKKLPKDGTPGLAETRMKEEKRGWLRDIWYRLHNARRFFRKLEGGKDDYLYHTLTKAEYDAFNEEWGHALERRENVAGQFKELGIKETDLVKHRFELWNGSNATLDEMLTFYYAQYNERALHAVVFGHFADAEERAALKTMGLEEQMKAEGEIAKRYWDDMKKLDGFFALEGNGKYKKVMEIIGRDYDDNYQRLKDFVAREYNEELGSEPYYMPLNRLGVVGTYENDAQKALAEYGLSKYIGKGFTKGRVDIPSFAQQPIKAGLFSTWDSMVQKQEHLMAYDSLMRQTKQVFESADNASELIRDTLRRGYSEAAVDYIKKWTSELAAPPVEEDLKALNKIHRVMRGHYPAAVMGFRIASVFKQAVESPPPFLQHMYPHEYAAAAISCLRKETRDMIYQKSVYLKVRYFDPAMAVMGNMEKMYLSGNMGKAEAALSKIENAGMKPLSWIDTACVMPGWLGAYRKKLAELNGAADNDMTAEQAEAEAVHYADQVTRDCQPSSVLMDKIPLMKGSKNPFFNMLLQFQTPIASIFQQLFIDAPVSFKNGRILEGLWTWGIYILLATVIGAMRDDEDEKLDPKNRAIDSFAMPIEMVPMVGSDIAYGVESLLRTGKIRAFGRTNFPVIQSGTRAVNAVSDGDWGKAAGNTVDALGYFAGLPVAAKRDWQKAIEEGRWHRVLGIK